MGSSNCKFLVHSFKSHARPVRCYCELHVLVKNVAALIKRLDSETRKGRRLDAENVEVDLGDPSGWTPLWWAVQLRHVTVVMQLLELGKANADFKGINGMIRLNDTKSGHGVEIDKMLETYRVKAEMKNE